MEIVKFHNEKNYLLASTLIATQFVAAFDTCSSSQFVKSCVDCSSSPTDRVIETLVKWQFKFKF